MPSLPIQPRINILSPTIANIMPGTTIAGSCKEQEQPQHLPSANSRLQRHKSYPDSSVSTAFGLDHVNNNMSKHTHLLENASTATSDSRVEELDMETSSEGLGPSSIVSSISTVPVTVRHRPFISLQSGKDDAESQLILPHAGTARANLAPSRESPNGTTQQSWAKRHSHQTVLQQHCAFFDQDGDGIIWPQDTFWGFYALGFGIFLSLLAVFIVHANFSYPTLDTWLPDPFFRLYIKNIHMDKHGSDTNTYDHEGRYIPQKFEDIFSKYAEGRDYLTIWDVAKMLRGQRCFADPIGWGGAFFEWLATYLMLWPADGRMMKEDIRRIYDGSLFFVIAERRSKKTR